MGFQYWWEAMIFVFVFGALVGIPCFFIAFIGARMFNDLGNFPSQSAQIQMRALGKVALVEIAALSFLALFFQIFY